MIIDGKEIALKIKQELKEKLKKLENKPSLAVILVGNDSGSQIYVRNKKKACEEIGINSIIIKMPDSISENELIIKIKELNNDDDINGILVQLPLPKQINTKKIINLISPSKDVDGFHPLNLGSLFSGYETIVPCTPKGIIKLIETTGVEISGKNSVVIGRSNIVGKPLASMLLNRNATVTICHSKTKDLKKHTLNADILVSAVGKLNLITADMVKKNSVVIDTGMNRLDNGRLTGDVDFENVKNIVSYITPVPGGVGPMTIASLLENTFLCYKMQKGDN